MLLVKYFISSNTSLSELANPHLLALINHLAGPNKPIKLPLYNKFRHTLLPKVLEMMYKELESKLKSAASVILIVDMWSKNATDFIAIGGALMYHNFDREIVILNMQRMERAHTGEYVKKCVEDMINRFEFDKSKVHCIYCFKSLYP